MQAANYFLGEKLVGVSGLSGNSGLVISDAFGWFQGAGPNTLALFTKGATYPGGATPSVNTFQSYNDLEAPFETFLLPPLTKITCKLRANIHANNYTAGTDFAGHFDIVQVTGQSTPGTNPPTWIALTIGPSLATIPFTTTPNSHTVLESNLFTLENNTLGFLEFAPLLTMTTLSTGNTGLLSIHLQTLAQ